MGASPPISRKRRIEYMNWETVNPLWWVPRGYVCRARRQPRLRQVARAHRSLVAHRGARLLRRHRMGRQRNPGATGASARAASPYFAMTQWLVAGLKPPSLKAMIPWEGAADMYRDFGYHGGIFSFSFVVRLVATTTWRTTCSASRRRRRPTRSATPWLWEYMRYNLDGEWYRGRRRAWENIDMPALQRRQLERHGAAPARQHRRLPARRVEAQEAAHPRRHALPPFYSAEGRLDQLRFFDHWLKGDDTGIMRRAAGEAAHPQGRARQLRVALRERVAARRARGGPSSSCSRRRAVATKRVTGAGHRGAAQGELGFLLRERHDQGRRRQRLLDVDGARRQPAADGRVVRNRSARGRHRGDGAGRAGAVGGEQHRGHGYFRDHPQHRARRPGRVRAGPAESAGSGGQGLAPRLAPQARPALSLPCRPYHTHTERESSSPAKPVRVEVEIWPTCMVFKKGHRIRLDIQPRDGIGSAPYTHYAADYNSGTNTIFAGGARASYLLLPDHSRAALDSVAVEASTEPEYGCERVPQ